MYNPNYGAYQASGIQPQTNPLELNFYGLQYQTGNPMAAQGPPFFDSGLLGLMENQYSANASHGVGNTDGQLPKGILAAFSTLGYPGEPPLLEELDINFSHIKIKTLAVLLPSRQGMRGDVSVLNDSDLGGPIVFALLYGVNLLLAGKVHFGYIYGCGLFGTLSLFSLFRLMSNEPRGGAASPEAKGQELDYLKTTSIIGYCLLPLVLLSLLGIFFTLDNIWGYIVSFVCTLWLTYAASGLFVVVMNVENSRFLIAYPLLLFYSIFALMAIFVENA